MPCVVRDGTFKVCVYAADHPPPHCHVYWAGDNVALVDLTALTVIAGDRLPRRALPLIQANLGLLWAEWHRLNP